MPKMKKHHSVQLLGTIDKTTAKGRENMCWDRYPRWRPHTRFGNPLSKHRTCTLCTVGNPRTSRSIQHTFFSQWILEFGQAKDLRHVACAKYEAIEEKGPRTGRLRSTGRQARRGNNPEQEVQDIPWQSHHDAINVLDMESAQKKEPQLFQMLSGCITCFDTISKDNIRDRADKNARIRVSVAYISWKIDDSDSVGEPD